MDARFGLWLWRSANVLLSARPWVAFIRIGEKKEMKKKEKKKEKNMGPGGSPPSPPIFANKNMTLDRITLQSRPGALALTCNRDAPGGAQNGEQRRPDLQHISKQKKNEFVCFVFLLCAPSRAGFRVVSAS